tara:strand:- start:1307 stop:1429 length:123 start_codon:yes stop_codon:yes gene_type:complete
MRFLEDFVRIVADPQFGSCEIKEQNSVKEYYFVFAEAVKR